MAKDAFYFSHDYNTRSDEKIKKLIRKHGMLGYGIWWAIIEDLYNNANALRTDYEGIAYELRVDETVVKSIINDFDLFIIEDGIFGSISVSNRIDERNKKSVKARESAYKRWERNANASKLNANALNGECERNAIKDSIVKKENIYAFEDFWNDYDKKIDSKKCKLKWAKIPDADKLKIKEFLPKYKESTPDIQYRKNPATFLNNQCWNDEIVFRTNKIEAMPERKIRYVN